MRAGGAIACPSAFGFFALAFLALVSPAHAAPQLVAEQITPARFEALRVGGPDADGGVGDWALRNGTICAVISDAAHESALSPSGGILIDLGHCDRDNDQWSTLQPLLDFDRSRELRVREIAAETGEGVARIVTRSEIGGAALRTVYSVDLEDPTRLQIDTEIRRGESDGWLFSYGDVVIHATGQLRPFALLRRDLARSRGFQHPATDLSKPLSLLDSLIAVDAHVFVGGEGFSPIAYGLVQRGAFRRGEDGNREVLPSFANSSNDHTMWAVLAGAPWLGVSDPPGVAAFAQLPFLGLDEGEVLEISRELRLGDRLDVASVTDALFADGVVVTGRTHPEARVHVAREDGAPITVARPGADGSFSFRVPPGPYRLRFVTPWDDRSREIRLEGPEPLALGEVALSAPGTVRLPRGMSARLTFLGEGATPHPRLGDDGFGVVFAKREATQSGLSNALSLIGGDDDPESVTLPPGDYRVLASRGPEFHVTEQRFALAAGETLRLRIAEPTRAIESPGWIAADLHVHSAESYDSAFPLERQIAAFAALEGEVMVASEHDRVFDPRPTVRRLGLSRRMVGIVGVEVTASFPGLDSPYTIGHMNAFPVPYERNAYRGGAPRAEGRRLRDVIADLHALPTKPLAQLNHPREARGRDVHDGAYFSHLAVAGAGFDPRRSLADAPNSVLLEPQAEREGHTPLRDIDYDAVELLNGPNLERYRVIRADWFSLLRQGIRHTATANSDTHRAGVLPSLPRNYVAMRRDRILDFDEKAFVKALRRGQSYGTTGPLLIARLEDAGPGDTFRGREGVLRVRIDAAPWVPVESLRVFTNGVPKEHREVRAGDSFEMRLKFDADAFVTVEVRGPTSPIYRAVAPGFTPFAFTNPIFVDFDEDDAWTPPGVEGGLPVTLTDPREAP